jgi:polar amino acid transport system substrate-binding protein
MPCAVCYFAVPLLVAMLGAGVVCQSTCGDEVESLRSRLAGGLLRWGGDAEGGAPYQLRDPKDPQRVIGFEVDLAGALAARLGDRLHKKITAQFVQYEWVSLPLGLERGDFDLILSGFEDSPQRAKAFLLSRPYYICHQELAVRKDDQRIGSLKDCRGRQVGTLSGSAAERTLVQLGIGPIVGFDGQVEPYLDLELGRLDAVLLDGPISTYYARPNPRLKTLAADAPEVRYVMAFRPGDTVLATAVDAALSELMISGQLAATYRRWHLWNADQAQLAAGPRRLAELQGLGFDATGQPRPNAHLVPANAVDVNLLVAASGQWRFSEYAPLLLHAALITVELSIASMALAVVLGLFICILRLYGPWPAQWAALMYVEFFRGIPLLLLLFFLYFGLANYGVDMPAMQTAILGFGLNFAAYEAEIYRSAIQSVPRGQWEAALALGMSPALAFRRIIFPQALRTALAPMTNDFIALFKDTSLVSVIAVHELTKEYLILSRSSLKFVELGLLTAALYLAMSVPLGHLSRWLEARWGAAA